MPAKSPPRRSKSATQHPVRDDIKTIADLRAVLTRAAATATDERFRRWCERLLKGDSAPMK